MSVLIEVRQMSHVYEMPDNKVNYALRAIDLSIEQGEFVAVIGTNGSGKSTLARHFNALLKPTEGICLINGLDTRDEANLWQIRQTVGMVFQNPDNQIVAALVEDDVAFGPENIGVPREEMKERIQQALATVNMSEYAHHAPHLLSGGQKQRVAIAGVLALLPRCIVLDEPTVMLDPRGRAEITATVQKLNKEKGITVIYITHKMEEALLADRIVVMEAGSIVLTGTPREVFGQTKRIKELGLEVPLAAEVAEELRSDGMDLQTEIITSEELAEALCR